MSPAPAQRTVELQDRDLQILRGLFESRVMTAEHAAAFWFDGRYEAARKRVQKLKAAGYVGERPRRAYDPAVLFLTKKAFAALCEASAIADLPRLTWKNLEKRVRVSPLTLKHELEVQDVKAAFYRALPQVPDLRIPEFTTWPLMCQFRAYTPAGQLVTAKPDGMFRVIQTSGDNRAFEHTFYLEVDRSTEKLETLALRAACYRDYYRRGGLAVRSGHNPAEYEHFPFRVLMICKTAERRNNVAEALLSCRPPILSQVWLTTFAEITDDPFSQIWVRPADYRAAGCSSTVSEAQSYRRHTERESSIERNLRKQLLFAPPRVSE